MEIEHERLNDALIIKEKLDGFIELMNEIVTSKDRWALIFTTKAVADICKQAAAQMDKSVGNSELAEFCKSVTWN